MTQPVALIQLVSAQTMQNLVPVLALQPALLVHLTTEQTALRSEHIVTAAKQCGFSAPVEHLRLAAMPSIAETSRAVTRAVKSAREAGLVPVINFTGGTKLMSIGAYGACTRENATSLYVDTDHREFVDGMTGPAIATVLGGDPGFGRIEKSLTVSAVAAANGRDHVSAGRDWAPFLPLAKAFLADPGLEVQTHAALHGPDGIIPGGREPRTAADWLPLLDRDFSVPATVAKLAIEAGLLEPAGRQSTCRLPSSTRHILEHIEGTQVPDYLAQYYRATGPIQQVLSFLTGGWWEVAVAQKASEYSEFRDVRWSTQVGEKSGVEFEEDVVALHGVQVVYISCKRGGARARLVPLLDEMNARARNIGGSFTRRFLAIYEKPRGRILDNLASRARELGIQLVFPENLTRKAPFAPRNESFTQAPSIS